MKRYYWIVIIIFAVAAIAVVGSYIFKGVNASQGKSALEMSQQELLNLSDENLIMAVVMRQDNKAGGSAYEKESITAMNEAERTAYIAAVFDAEMNNGGLAKFLADFPYTVPYLTDALNRIGASKTAGLFTAFAAKYSLDLSALPDFNGADAGKLASQYHLSEFDSAFLAKYGEENLTAMNAKFIRANIGDIAG